MTKSKAQKAYAKRKERYRQDTSLVSSSDSQSAFPYRVVNPKPLCIRVSEEAHERLKHWADHWGWNLKTTLNHIITTGIPKYSHHHGDDRHRWDDELINPEELNVNYKGNQGTKMIHAEVTSTTYRKLQSHKTILKQSMARIVQFLIMRYQPTPEAQLEKMRERYREVQDYKSEWN